MKKYFHVRVAVDTNIYTIPYDKELFRYGAELIVQTEFGEDLAYVTSFPFESDARPGHMARAVRQATKEDRELSRERELQACQIKKEIRQLVHKLGLHMNLTHVLVPIKGKKICVFYTAKGRVDFRGLLRSLRPFIQGQRLSLGK